MGGRSRPSSKLAFTGVQRLLSTRLVTGAGMFFSRYLPPPIGVAVGHLIAGLVLSLKPRVYRTVCANLRQVLGPEADEKAVRQIARRVFYNAARNYYELWHLVGRGRQAVSEAVEIPSEDVGHLEEAVRLGKGVLIVGAHVGNFDLGMLALTTLEPLRGERVQVLGLADAPGGGFYLMDRMRARAGLDITPIDLPALRRAIRHLRAGGVVLTGVDRPVREEALPLVEFFGRPAPLPTGHVRLALKTDAVILVASAYRTPGGRNAVSISPPVKMIRTGDPAEDLQVNLRRVTALMESYIRARPDQWQMFVPVWGEG